MAAHSPDADSIRRFEDDNDQGEGSGLDRLGPLPGLAALSNIANTIVDAEATIKEAISTKIDAGEQLAEELLTETAWGAVLDELFFAGNMPVLQEYLTKRSFLQETLEPNKKSTCWDTISYVIFSALLLVNIVLRGISQVYLCNNPLSGILICIGLYLTDPKLLVYAIVGTASATTGAFLLCLPASSEILSGLTGYDGALIGCAVFTFISPDDASSPDYDDIEGSFRSKGMAITVVLAALSGFLHMSCRHSCSLPALTLSFNICMLAFLLTLTDNRVRVTELGWEPWEDDFSADEGIDEYWISANFRFFHDATARGVGQFMFVGNTLGAWMVILGIAVTSRTAAVAAILGSFVASLTATFIFEVPPSSLVAVHNGLYGYSAAGTCVAIGGGVFYHASPIALLIGMAGAVFAVTNQLAIEAILISDNLALPSLTIPFVLTTWLMMLSRSAWLDPKTEGDEDMDDVLTKDKVRNWKSKRNAPSKPVVDDPSEKWNTRDKSQIDRRASVRAALSKPFTPMIKKISSNKLLKTDNSQGALMKFSSPPEKKSAPDPRVHSDERRSESKSNEEGMQRENYRDSNNRTGELGLLPRNHTAAIEDGTGSGGSYAARYQAPPKNKVDLRKIAVDNELEDF